MATSAIIALIFAILGTAASVGTGIYANAQNKKIADQNIQEARATREDSQEFAREQQQTANNATYLMFNAMDSPQARVQQLKEAGMSPGLMYGNGSGSVGSHASATGSAPGATPGTNAPFINPLVNLQQSPTQAIKEMVEAVKTSKESSKIEKETEKAGYEINEIIAKTKKTEEETKTQVVTRNFTETQNKLAENQLKINNATIKQQIEIVEENVNLLKQNVNRTRQEIRGLRIDNQYKSKLYQSTLDLNSNLTTKYIAETAKAVADKTLTYAEKNLIDKQKELTEKQIAELEQKIRQAKKIADEYDEYGYKVTEANNWATELMSILRELKTRSKEGNIIDLTQEFWGMSDEEYQEWLKSRK